MKSIIFFNDMAKGAYCARYKGYFKRKDTAFFVL